MLDTVLVVTARPSLDVFIVLGDVRREQSYNSAPFFQYNVAGFPTDILSPPPPSLLSGTEAKRWRLAHNPEGRSAFQHPALFPSSSSSSGSSSRNWL